MKKQRKPINSIILSCCLLGVLTSSVPSCLKDPDLVGIESMTFKGRRDSILFLEIAGTIYNPNGIGAVVDDMQSEVFIDGQFVGESVSLSPLQVKAKSLTTATMELQLNLRAFSRIFPVVMSKDSSLVEIQGDYSVNLIGKLARLKRHATVKERMAIREAFNQQMSNNLSNDAVRLKRVIPAKFGLRTSQWKIDLAVYNQLAIDYSIENIDLELWTADGRQQFGECRVYADYLLEPFSSQVISSEVKVVNLKVARQLLNMLGGNRQVLVRGTVQVSIGNQQFAIPIRQQITTN